MAIVYHGTDLVGTGTQISPKSNNDYYIASGVTIGSTGGYTVLGTNDTNINVTVMGDVFGSSGGFYFSENDGTTLDLSFLIGENGSVISGRWAMYFNGDSTSITGRIAIVNHGTISSEDAAISARYIDDFRLTNTRTITITDPTFNEYALDILANDVEIINSGTISVFDDADAIHIEQPANGTPGGFSEIFNSGLIAASKFASAIYSTQKVDFLTNEGTIRGSVLLDRSESSSLAFDDTIQNSGTISGNIQVGYGNDEIYNNGLIEGTVYLGFGDDVFEGESGTLDGIIYGNGGDDIIKTGLGDDFIDGGSGRDRMYGGAGNDTVSYEYSSAGVRVNLTTHRGRGDDARGDWLFDIENLIGSGYGDALIGDEFSNILEGLDGADTLTGEGGADFLFGGNGDDTLIAGDGDDILNGSLGRDILWSGDGADIFEYLDIAESVVGADRDIIRDFEQDTDLIDLSAIGATSFSAGGFTNTAGEVTSRLLSGGSKTLIEFDQDGDGTADFHILMTNGGFTITEGDFILG